MTKHICVISRIGDSQSFLQLCCHEFVLSLILADSLVNSTSLNTWFNDAIAEIRPMWLALPGAKRLRYNLTTGT